MDIQVDHREQADGVMSELRARGHSVSECELKVGDYRVEGLLIIERKTLPDFARSVVDGRLFRQASRLVWQKEAACLILEGTSRDLQDIHVSRPALQGALTTLSLVYGLSILRSMNQKETASLIEIAADQLTRHRSGALKRPGTRPKGARKQKLYILQSLPGIGPERAEQILDRFETIENFVEADYEDLLQLEGIGPTTAKRLYNVLRETSPTYGSPESGSFLRPGSDEEFPL